jgi:urate oxidase
MESLRLSLRELSFLPVALPGAEKALNSEVLFSRSYNDFSTVTMDFVRGPAGIVIGEHECGRIALELFKVTGSAFTSFVRDEYTTLPDRVDRPLFIHLDLTWKYSDLSQMLASDLEGYVPSEQVRDLIQVVFDEFVSESIQHLVYEMGARLLERFPQLVSVTFDAENRTRELVVAAEGEARAKVYTDPFTAYGNIKLTLGRNADEQKV